MWTNHLHSLIWTDLQLIPNSPIESAYSHGAWFWIHSVFSYTIVLVGMVVLVRGCLNAPATRQWQTTALIVGALAPLLAYLLYVSGLLPGVPVGLVVLACTFSGLIYLPAMLGLRMLDLTPVARGAIIEQMSDAVLVMDSDGRIADINPAVERLLCLNTRSWLGQPFAEAIAAFPKLAALGSPDAPTHTTEVLNREPPIYVDIQKTTLSDSKKRPVGMLLLLRDITQLKLAEQREFDLALEHERVRLLSRFIRDASHEFRTPLAIINTSLYFLGKQADPEMQRVQRDKIAAQVEQINTLLEDMLTMSRLDDREPLNLSDVDINALLASIAQSGSTPPTQQASISLDLAEELPPVRGDVAQLRRALNNLYQNAIQYSTERGSIQISTRQLGDYILITVHDSGIGIDQAAQSHIFERFFRNDDAHSTAGLGLGLPMTQAIIEAHGGAIQLQSASGQGSTFTVQLPATTTSAI